MLLFKSSDSPVTGGGNFSCFDTTYRPKTVNLCMNVMNIRYHCAFGDYCNRPVRRKYLPLRYKERQCTDFMYYINIRFFLHLPFTRIALAICL